MSVIIIIITISSRIHFCQYVTWQSVNTVTINRQQRSRQQNVNEYKNLQQKVIFTE